ncbi:hypothetical protein THRCLA_20906 [Thraustotheca clavata]|uniref:Uncharacterized protein n=1 Tax=Thraustotheca clavata TaxID=74557 RepID=A0A1W0A2U2_9STRA|nr:hypothetical protein THRCLA_20906 [Thraustotheca clavata]
MLRREPTRLDVKEELADEYEDYRREMKRMREERVKGDVKRERELFVMQAKEERERRIGLRR